jgi:hypothetical protein
MPEYPRVKYHRSGNTLTVKYEDLKPFFSNLGGKPLYFAGRKDSVYKENIDIEEAKIFRMGVYAGGCTLAGRMESEPHEDMYVGVDCGRMYWMRSHNHMFWLGKPEKNGSFMFTGLPLNTGCAAVAYDLSNGRQYNMPTEQYTFKCPE